MLDRLRERTSDMLTRQELIVLSATTTLVAGGSTKERRLRTALNMALDLTDIADAWQRYQRGDLSREEFEGTLSERCNAPPSESSEQRTLDESGQPRLHVSLSSHRMTRCQSDDDGACDWEGCPQNRDGEPHKSGRHCPLDTYDDEDE